VGRPQRVFNDEKSTVKHAPFHASFLWTSMMSGLLIGFAIAAHLSSILGLGLPVSIGFVSFVQVHGHVQLVGWAGLFVMGVSLHFLPRLAGSPIQNERCLGGIVWLVSLGLVFRSIGQSVLPYIAQSPIFLSTEWGIVVSGVLIWLGILSYVYLLLGVFRRAHNTATGALFAVRPYLLLTIAGWLLYGALNLALLIKMAIEKHVVVDPAWNHFGIQLFVCLVLLPIAFAFSVRTFPLYLRLPLPANWVSTTAYAYCLAVLLQLFPTLPPLRAMAPTLTDNLEYLGMVGKSIVILWFVWQLDVLTRIKKPWTVNRIGHPGAQRRPTRPGLPDYGEFGCFELLVYASYIWLVFGAITEISSGITRLLKIPFFVSPHIALHIYLLGFISLLIFGMAVRMIPGFLKKRRVAVPALVTATFWLGNTAVIGRLLIFFLPPVLTQRIPGLLWFARMMFAISGLLAMAAVGCLALNLWRTHTQSDR
jgi:uncharacterized protein involved in response to NO